MGVPPGPSQCWADRKEFARGEAPFRSAGPISHLVTRAQTYLDRPLIDKTGLTGNYEWATRFRSSTSEGDAPLFADALNRDLGLRIEGATGPYEVIVVEGVEMPTPN